VTTRRKDESEAIFPALAVKALSRAGAAGTLDGREECLFSEFICRDRLFWNKAEKSGV
jgi:hypothetical protein